MTKYITTLFLGLGSLFLGAQSFDTTGMTQWAQRYNSYETWMQGAFDAYRDTSDMTDFGWGNYSITSHLIEGDSIYILKTVSGQYKAISIDNLASGVYSITYSDLDGSNQVSKSLDRDPYEDRNFFYYSIDHDQIKDLEPNTADWDIIFTKYPIMFPGFGAYPVAGVLHNRGVETARIESQTAGTAQLSDTLSFPFSASIASIGYDWKDAFAGVVFDTLTYFVKDQNGQINELEFVNYGGSANGNMSFTVNGVLDSISLGAGNDGQVYYSLNNRAEVAQNTDLDWDIALFAQSSFAAVPVRINDIGGAELYVYPHKDIMHWTSIGIEENPMQLLSVWPNPAKDHLNLALSTEASQNISLRVFSIEGRLVKQENLSVQPGISEQRIDLSAVPAGMYQVQIEGENYGAQSRILIQP